MADKKWWKEHGKDVPPFDSKGEDVAKSHEDRREGIADDVEGRRDDRAVHVEERRERIAQDVEDLSVHRLRFVTSISLAAAIVAIALGVVSYVQATRIDNNRDAINGIAKLQRQIDADALERRSDTCRSFEQQHKQEIDQLKRTYDYLVQLSPQDRRSSLNRTVAAGVPQSEKNARSDQDDFGVFVPKYCDAKNVGLPEPDPTVPKRPAALKPPTVPAPLP